MPVHLFGRPAGARSFRRARRADHRGRRAGVRRRRHRHDRRRLDLQLLPDEEPLRARRRRPLRVHRHGARRARAHAALPRLQGQEDVRVRRLQLAPRRAPGGGAAAVPDAARRLEPAAPRGRGPLRRAGPRRGVRAAGRRAGPRVPHVRRTDARARPPRRRAARGRDRVRLVLRRPAAPPAGAALPRLGRGLAPGDGGGRGRQPRAAAVGRDQRRRSRSAWSRRSSRRRGWAWADGPGDALPGRADARPTLS